MESNSTIEVGSFLTLEVYQVVKHGYYLTDNQGGEILLPKKLATKELTIEDKADVFIYRDSQERMVATMQMPAIKPYEFAFLRVVEIASFGAFVNWGLDRDLLIPNHEQAKMLQLDEKALVYLFVDEEDRLTGTTHISRCVSNEDCDLSVGDEVSLLIYQFSDIGIKAIINHTYDGLLYKDQVQKLLNKGDVVKGYVNRIREDQKIDLSLHRFGYGKVLDNKDRVLQALSDHDGFLPLHDKSDPQVIKRELEMSKKVFKKVIGGLYKEKKIRIEQEGIYLADKK